ncbi:hypothetical protein [Variovorax sp. J31P207]|uniref:hypothetical protein n=1 Tax=Variovorax sp. J31P207 TaxID=3053510 RepID=UPI002577C661|nr:hypothetical protein [Variovorax sp. J31P207]MDM0067058.1 hypothetical protein [Variovorax sp. J31P207]
MSNLYDALFAAYDPARESTQTAATHVATAYLDGRPKMQGRRKVSAAQRNRDLWSCAAWQEVPAAAWRSEIMVLALARYFAQEQSANPTLLHRIALACPESLCVAVRRSRLVLKPTSARRQELDAIAASQPDIAELCRVLDIFAQAHRDRLDEVEELQRKLAHVTPFELLILASLHAFEEFVPESLSTPQRSDGSMSTEQVAWHAINDILLWKLGSVDPREVSLDDTAIEASFGKYLAPALRRGGIEPSTLHADRVAFRALIGARIELNEFMSRSVDAFCFDDAIRFVRRGNVLEIEQIDQASRLAWERDGRKLARLHEYWFYRAMAEFRDSSLATQTIGRPENHEANRLAYLRATRTRLRLGEVYGVAEQVTTEEGERLDLFQALLALELTSSFFQRDFLEVFTSHLRDTGDWVTALRLLAADGLQAGFQNRFPLTWSDRAAKITNIVGWTVTPASPNGCALMAARILDFWTSDWTSLVKRVASPSEQDHAPELFERPYLKLGSCLVQLPWLVGLQNNSTAAINNLRRLGQRRGEFRAETQQIEANLARALQARGFAVALNWMPDRESFGDAGEVDVVCALDGVVIVMEVKSTFIRMSQRDAWAHATSTLRKAGGQVLRKVAAVQSALRTDSAFCAALGLHPSSVPRGIHGWIVDTSIECDHQFFSGCLKVSLEEILIALRDDVELTHDPERLFGAQGRTDSVPPMETLYPDGFSGPRFCEVITSAAVWAGV